MEEKVLIKSEQYNIKKNLKIMVIIGAVLSIILLYAEISLLIEMGEMRDALDCFFVSLLIFSPIAIFTFVGFLIYLWLHSYELTVTDKRIYGKVAWGKRIDLPVDSVSAIATIRILKGVSVSTSSGRISFRVIKNADEICVMHEGRIVERGKHEELLQLNGYYKRLNDMQAL